MTEALKTYSKREVSRLVREMAERHGGQSMLGTALGFNATTISRAATGVSVSVALTDALGLIFDDRKGRYVQVRDAAFVTGVDALAALTSDLADAKLSLKAARIQIASLREEVERLKSKLNGNARVAA